jgi:hypothetical protein
MRAGAFLAGTISSSPKDTPSKLWGAMAAAREAGNRQNLIQDIVFMKF